MGHRQLPVGSHAHSENLPLHPVSKQPPCAVQEQSINDQVGALAASNCTLQQQLCQNMPEGFLRGTARSPLPAPFPSLPSLLTSISHSRGWEKLGHPDRPHSSSFSSKVTGPSCHSGDAHHTSGWRFAIRAACDSQYVMGMVLDPVVVFEESSWV